MHDVALDLLILLAGIWLVAVTLRPIGLPTVMGELIVGVVVGPAVFGLIQPNEAIALLAEIGIFFLMFHAGVETQPREFFDALKRSMGVAVVGAIVPFTLSFLIARAFGLSSVSATFVGLTMTATAVVITLKSLKDLGLSNTRVARVIIASCVIDDLLTLVVFSLVIGVLSGGDFEPLLIVITLGKVLGFFAVSLLIGRFIYPLLSLPFRSEGGKGFTFVLLTAIAAGLFAEAIGLHMILGAYLAGLFFEKKVAHPNLVKVVLDRTYGIAYSFLGPIFFISLGFSITFDISAADFAFLAILTSVVIVGQILSAGGMALRMGMPVREALTVGVGMCGRAEMAFILASLALAQQAITQTNFSVLIFTAFLLNLFTPLALKGCAILLEGRAEPTADATRGVMQLDKFDSFSLDESSGGVLARVLPPVRNAVVIYGYGPEVDPLLTELEGLGIPAVLIEENEGVARRLQARGHRVVFAALSEHELDLEPLKEARALVANGMDDPNAHFVMKAREGGFDGPIVAMIRNRYLRASIMLAGVTTSFIPAHVLAAVIAARASSKIGPRVAGVQPLGQRLEVAELRIHEASPLARRTLAETQIRTVTGANIVGQWYDDELRSPPGAREPIQPGMILVAAGPTESIQGLRAISNPITEEGRIIVVGLGDLGRELVEIFGDADEEVSTIDLRKLPGVDVVGDVIEPEVLERAGVRDARVVILAMGNDSSTLLATKMIRDHAPEVPIIAGVVRHDQVPQIQQAGADYAVSVGQVSGQILAYHVLGETVSLGPRIKIVKLHPGPLAGRSPLKARVREHTGCTIVAVSRGEQVFMEFPPSFTLEPEDALYLCGTTNAINRYHDTFPGSLP